MEQVHVPPYYPAESYMYIQSVPPTVCLQVQHILASTSPGGRSVVWDLRKNEPIIQVTDSSSRVRCTGIAWHPDVATQMMTSSGDDRAPVIQVNPVSRLRVHTVWSQNLRNEGIYQCSS